MDSERRRVGLVVGALGPILVALVLVPLRDTLHNANLALILMAVVVIAAIVGGRGAAAIAAVTATMAFDFFLTVPYNSMRIESADDIETVVIFLAVGLLVGEVAARFRQSRQDRERAAVAIERVHRVAARVAEGAPLDDVAVLVVTETRAVLRLQDCWLEVPSGLWPAPRLERAGTISETELRWGEKGFTLPEDGLQPSRSRSPTSSDPRSRSPDRMGCATSQPVRNDQARQERRSGSAECHAVPLRGMRITCRS